VTNSADKGNPPRASQPLPALGFIAVLIFAWGGNYTWIKLALRDIGPWTFNAVRFCGAALVVGMMLALRGGADAIVPARGERLRLAVVGVLQGALLPVLITVSLSFIASTHTILLIYTNPVWTLLLSALMLREPPTAASIAGTALGLLGMALLTNPLAMRWDGTALPGVVSALIGAIAWALGSVLYRRAPWRSTFWQQAFWQLAVGAVVTTLAAALIEGHDTVRPTARLAAVTIYNVLVPTALAYWCWAQALSRIRASTASQVLLLSPVFGVVQSSLILGEPLGAVVMASGFCIICGAALTLWRRPN
jgi:drug/metabolite transporter (DMT)-like permease